MKQIRTYINAALCVVVLWGVCLAAPVSANEANGFRYDFEDYAGGAVKIQSPHAAAPYLNQITLGGRTSLLEGIETEAGRVLWMRTASSAYSYLFGQVTAEPTVYDAVVQFDVKTLGYGEKPLTVSLWDSGENAASAQYAWNIYPDGTLKIYAGGRIGEYECYTQTAAVPLREGQGTAYTGTYLVTAPVDTWVNLAAAFNFTERTIDYYVDHKLVFSEAAFYSGALPGGFSLLRLQMNTDTAFDSLTPAEQAQYGMYIDNLRVYGGSRPDTALDTAYYGTACDFEDYTGGELSYVDYDTVAPFKDSVIIRGQCKNSRAVETEKGTSLWLLVDDSGSGDQYMEGELLQKTVADKVVMQFDVKPLGLGSPTKFGMKGLKADGNQFFQQMFTVNPDGTLRIYARGKIAGAGAEESCYTENDSVTLRRGSGTAYTSAEAVTIPVGEWARLAVVYDVAGKKMDYYVNGELIFGKAVPFNNGNDLAANGVNRIRMQTARYKEYSQHTEEEQQQVGLYIDNLKVFLGSAPAELTKGYYEAALYDGSGKKCDETDILQAGQYQLQLTLRGNDTAGMVRQGTLIAAQYADGKLTGVELSQGTVTRERETTVSVFPDYMPGAELVLYFWDERQRPVIRPVQYGRKELYIEFLGTASDVPGNIFTQEQGTVKVQFQNLLDHAGTAEIGVALQDGSGRLLMEETYLPELEKYAREEISCSVRLPDYGTYTLTVSALGTGGDVRRQTYHISRVLAGAALATDFGVNTHFNQGKGNVERNLDLIQAAGMGWIRDEISWASVEQEKGVLNIQERWDRFVDEARTRGQEVLLILGAGNPLYADGKFPTGDEAVAAFANYAGAVAAHFAGQVSCYEIFNEPYTNRYYSSENTGEAYAELVKAAAEAIRAADPEVKIAANLECFTRDTHHYNYTKAALNAGICSSVDIISIHPYVQPAAPDDPEKGLLESCETFFRDTAPYGCEIWITEIGWASCPQYVSQREAAAGIVKTKIMNMAEKRFDKIFIYDFQDDGNDPNDSEQNYGMIRAWQGNLSPDSAKEAYLAVSAASKLLAGCGAGEAARDGGIRQYGFQNNQGQRVLAFWSRTGPGEMELTDLPNQIVLYDMFGNGTVFTSSTGTYTIPVDLDVAYIVYDESE